MWHTSLLRLACRPVFLIHYLYNQHFPPGDAARAVPPQQQLYSGIQEKIMSKKTILVAIDGSD
ncbi:MAG: hypothetical protein V2I36_09390, partial [Desulfopila sp.]|nr:hypothetical protein [Desulfopila sp.]